MVAFSTAGLVPGCPTHEWDPKPVDASQSAIRFDHADFDPDLAEYALDRDPRTGSELYVARFFGADAFAAVLVFKAGASYVVKDRPTEARGYGQFWGMRSGSGLVPGSGDGLAVAETDAANDLAEALGAVQSPPVPLG